MTTFNITSNREAILSLMDVTNAQEAIDYVLSLSKAFEAGVLTLTEFECNVNAFSKHIKDEDLSEILGVLLTL